MINVNGQRILIKDTAKTPGPTSKFLKKRITSFISSVLPLMAFSIEVMAENATINNNEEREITHQWDLGNAGTLQVGRDTNGTLTVSSGGQINTNLLSIGRYAGDGEVNVINGGIITINNNNSYSYPLAIGGEGASSGNSQGTKGILNIAGTGSQVIVNSSSAGEMGVGSQGAEGLLNITDGGKLTAYIDRFYIGSRGSTTKGVVIVDGVGSELYSSGRIFIGTFNEGQVFVSNGGIFKTDDFLSLAYTDHSFPENTLVVSGKGSLAQSKNETNIGVNGKGVVVVSDKGTLSASQINIAQSKYSVGQLAIGSRKGDAPTAAGTIETDSIQFKSGQGTLVFNHLDHDFELKAAISGKGSVQAINGTSILSGANTYTGVTSIADGATIQAGATNTFSANATYDIDSGGTLNLNNYDQTIGNITNAGTVNFGAASKNIGAILTVAGDYIGNNGALIFNGALNSDGDSITDKLVITGNSSGNTKVRVNNIGGFGALTINGIDIIEVHGAPNGVFEQDGRIVAGAYDYFLTQGGVDEQGNLDQKWYLQSKFIPDDSGGGSSEGGGSSSEDGSTSNDDVPNIVRPEAGSYLSLLEYNQSTFNHSFHDRQQLLDNQYQSAWARVEYTKTKSKAADGQLNNKAEHTLIHFGSDLLQKDNLHLGLMGGFSQEDVNTRSNLSGYTAIAKSNGYSIGVYGTWFNQDKNNGGLYIDTYAQYNWFKNKVNGQDQPELKLNTKSQTLSAEIGYGFHLGQLGNMAWQIEPQIQLVYDHHNGKAGNEQNGTRVNINKLDHFASRAGVRFQGNSLRFKSFMTLNYWSHSKNATISMNGISLESNRARDILEVKAGGQIHLNKYVGLFTQVSSRWGGDSTSAFGGSIGVNVQW